MAVAVAASRNDALLEYYPMVRRIAHKAAATYGLPTCVDAEDLVSSGLLGLAEAFDRYDPDRGVAFEAFAVPRIRGAVIDAIRAADWVPRKVRLRARNTGEPVAALVSFDGVGSDGASDGPTPDRIADEDADEPGADILSAEGRRELVMALNHLPERERYIITQYYFHGTQLANVAKTFGVTESRVSQLHSRALRILREALEAIDTPTAA